jgi:hypothetical protein
MFKLSLHKILNKQFHTYFETLKNFFGLWNQCVSKNLDLDLRFSSDDDDGSPSEPEDNGRGLFPE